MWFRTSTADNLQTDPIVDRVINKFHERSQAGIKKHGTMLTRDDLSTLDWLKHLQEELQDATLYIERLMIVRESDRLEPVMKFMEALNINMDTIFEIAGDDGNIKTLKISDVFTNLNNKTMKTAVEWLEKEVNQYGILTKGLVLNLLSQAKEMDKQAHKETWDVAHQAGRFEGKGIAEENWQTFEEYWDKNI